MNQDSEFYNNKEEDSNKIESSNDPENSSKQELSNNSEDWNSKDKNILVSEDLQTLNENSDELKDPELTVDNSKKEEKSTIVPSEWSTLISDPNYVGSRRFTKFLFSGFYSLFILKYCFDIGLHISKSLVDKAINFYNEKYKDEHIELEFEELKDDIIWLVRAFSIDIYLAIKYKIEDIIYQREQEALRIYYDRVDNLHIFPEQARFLGLERHKGLPLTIPLFNLEILEGEYDIKAIRPIYDTVVLIKDNIVYYTLNSFSLAKENIIWRWKYHLHGSLSLVTIWDQEVLFKRFYYSQWQKINKVNTLVFDPINIVPDIKWKPKHKEDKKIFKDQKFFSNILIDLSVHSDDFPVGFYHAETEEKFNEEERLAKLEKKRQLILAKKRLKRKQRIDSWLSPVFKITYATNEWFGDKSQQFLDIVEKNHLYIKKQTKETYESLKLKANKLIAYSNTQIKAFIVATKKQYNTFYNFSKQQFNLLNIKFKDYLKTPEPEYDEDGNKILTTSEKFQEFLFNSKDYLLYDFKDDVITVTSNFYKNNLKPTFNSVYFYLSYVPKYIDYHNTKVLNAIYKTKPAIYVWNSLTFWKQSEIDADYVAAYNQSLLDFSNYCRSTIQPLITLKKNVNNLIFGTGKTLFFTIGDSFFETIRYLKYRNIYENDGERFCSVDPGMMWDAIPFSPKPRFNLLHANHFRYLLSKYKIHKSLTFNDFSDWLVAIKKYLTETPWFNSVNFLKLPKAILRFNSYDQNSNLFDYEEVNIPYDRLKLEGFHSYLDNDVYIADSLDEIPEIVYNYGSYSRLAIFIRALQEFLFGQWLYQMHFYNLLCKIYEYIDEKSHLPSFISRISTFINPYLTEVDGVLFKHPFIDRQREAHRLINKLRRWYLNFLIARNNREKWLNLFTYEVEFIYEYITTWVFYKRLPPPGKTKSLCAFRKLPKYDYSSHLDLENFQINYLVWNKLLDKLIILFWNWRVQKATKKESIENAINYFFIPQENLCKVHHLLIKFQRRNLKWYRWYALYKKRQARLNALRHIALLKDFSNFNATLHRREIIGTCQDKKYVLSMFIATCLTHLNQMHSWSTSLLENFANNYQEHLYWINTCNWNSEGERIIKARLGKYISNKELEIPLIKLLAEDINEVNHLLNLQSFPVLPLTPESVSLLMQDDLTNISKLFNKFHVKNPRRKVKPKDIFLPSTRGKVEHKPIEFPTELTLITDNFLTNFRYYEKLKKLKKFKKDYHEVHPFIPTYKKEFARHKYPNFIKSLLKSLYVHRVDIMEVDGISEKFEYNEIWNIKQSDNIKLIIKYNIEEKIHFTNL